MIARATVALVALGAATLWSDMAAAVTYENPNELLDLSGPWLFKENDNPAFVRPGLDDIEWKERNLPSVGMSWDDRWQGHGWYRLHINASRSVADADLMLTLGPARESVEVYVNGSLVAARGSFGVSPRSGARVLPLTGLVPRGVLKRGGNVIAIRVHDPTYSAGISAGPLLLGPRNLVEAQIAAKRRNVVFIRVALGLLALFAGLAQFFGISRRRTGRDTWWLAGAGVVLAVIHLSGLGLLDGLIPSATLSARLGTVLTPLGILCLGSYFATRYDDFGASHVFIGQLALLGVAALFMLLPNAAMYFAAEPTMLLVALVTTLYAAHLCAQAARRDDPTGLPLFIGLAGLAMVVVYDGFTASAQSVLPPGALMGSVAVMVLTAFVLVRHSHNETENVLVRMLHLKHRIETISSLGVLDASTMSSYDADTYLDAVIHEIAAEMEARRCSLMLKQADGSLKIRVAVGLPTEAMAATVDMESSIAGKVFRTGETVSTATLSNFVGGGSAGRYATDSFISNPVKIGGDTIGVLSVSDRNDGATFELSDEITVGEIVEKLAIIISRLSPQAWQPPVAHKRTKRVRRARAKPKARISGELDPSGEHEAIHPDATPPPAQPDHPEPDEPEPIMEIEGASDTTDAAGELEPPPPPDRIGDVETQDYPGDPEPRFSDEPGDGGLDLAVADKDDEPTFGEEIDAAIEGAEPVDATPPPGTLDAFSPETDGDDSELN